MKKKILQITSCDTRSIERFKNLKGSLKIYKRVHIGSFVLIFRIVDNSVIFEKFDHHDRIYKKK